MRNYCAVPSYRIIFCWWSWRRCLSTSSFAKISHYLDKESDDFLPWLREKAGSEISTVLSIGKSVYGRSLFSVEPIKAGDCILKVPYNVQIVPNNLHPDINTLLGDQLEYASKLAVVILFEQKIGKDSEWAPYIARLYETGEMHNTIFWSHKELEMIRPSFVYEETIKLRALLEKDFLTIKLALNHFPEIFDDVIFEDFMHAYALVGSRAWGSIEGLSLIPFADFLNHDGHTKAVVQSDEGNQVSEVIADRNYSPGDEVFVSYGKFSNAILMIDFGFTIPYNIYDQVQIRYDIPCGDFLRAAKLDLLHGHHTPRIKDDNDLNDSVNSFTIKEVKSFNGKGNGIPQSLRAFARVLCATSIQELEDFASEAAQSDGRLARLPLINNSKEIQAHQMLLFWISQLIDEYDASIQALGPLSCVRRGMAQQLLCGEVRVLRSAAAWLHNYCSPFSIANHH